MAIQVSAVVLRSHPDRIYALINAKLKPGAVIFLVTCQQASHRDAWRLQELATKTGHIVVGNTGNLKYGISEDTWYGKGLCVAFVPGSRFAHCPE
jgi:Mrp family chromosome partitioning ATPase